jgi:hypothetical protein
VRDELQEDGYGVISVRDAETIFELLADSRRSLIR